MILSIFIGYLVARAVHDRYSTPLIAMVIGLILGVLSGFWFIPLMYPLLVVQGTGVIIPENLELVFCFVVPDIVLYSDIVLREFPLSISILSVMIGAGAVGAVVGWWAGRVTEEPAKI